jgi:hypothetical protein
MTTSSSRSNTACSSPDAAVLRIGDECFAADPAVTAGQLTCDLDPLATHEFRQAAILAFAIGDLPGGIENEYQKCFQSAIGG